MVGHEILTGQRLLEGEVGVNRIQRAQEAKLFVDIGFLRLLRSIVIICPALCLLPQTNALQAMEPESELQCADRSTTSRLIRQHLNVCGILVPNILCTANV